MPDSQAGETPVDDTPADTTDPTSSDAPSTFDANGDMKPTDAQTKEEIKAWLDAHGVAYKASDDKTTLLALVEGYKAGE